MVDQRDTKQSNLVFVEQYVMNVLGFSSQYGSDVSISYTAYNITGKPSKFPEYGDFPQAFVMRTYGKWWSEAPSGLCTIMPQSVGKFDSQDFIDLEFEEAVYPYQVNVFETYNPGSVVKIWAADSKERWSLLWSGEPQDVGHMPRIFSPAINYVNFKTRVLRLEFYHRHLLYYTELDGVLLIGTKSPFANTGRLEVVPIGKLTTQIFEMKIHQIPRTVNIPVVIQDFFGEELPQFLSQSEDVTKSHHMLTENTSTSRKGFNCLPDETILKILSYLDLVSLCRCAQVNQHFHELATDALLYVELNLKAYWYCITPTALECLKTRCQYLQKLDLSWCGSRDVIKPQDFISFMSHSGGQITHLRLSSCNFIENRCMKVIAATCMNLKEICLRNCTGIGEQGFRALGVIATLQYIDLYRTLIELGDLVQILKASPRLKHLNLGSCIHINSMDEVTSTLATYNPELVSIDFWKTYSLTPTGVRTLSLLTNLEELDLGWCLGFGSPADSLLAVAHGCSKLRKLFLAALRGVTDRDLEPFVEYCPMLEQIDLLGSRSITTEICEKFLCESKHLKLLDISFCNQIPESQVVLWRSQYPGVVITRSFQRSDEAMIPMYD